MNRRYYTLLFTKNNELGLELLDQSNLLTKTRSKSRLWSLGQRLDAEERFPLNSKSLTLVNNIFSEDIAKNYWKMDSKSKLYNLRPNKSMFDVFKIIFCNLRMRISMANLKLYKIIERNCAECKSNLSQNDFYSN